MIPQFPQFKSLEVTDKKEIDRYASIFPPYSDFNFVSLYSWNIEEKIELSILNNNLVVKFQDYISGDDFFSFIGNTNVINTCKTLIDHAQKTGIVTKLQLIPEHVIQSEKDLINYFHIEEDRASFDYIYSLEELATLPGKKFHYKRRHLNKFNTDYPNLIAKVLDIHNPVIKKGLMAVFISWEKGKQKTREETMREMQAIERLLADTTAFNLIVVGIFDAENLVGYAIGEIVHNNYSIFHYLKADPSFRGIFTALYNNLAIHLYESGAKLLNSEQDLGIPGLMQSKLEWRPINFLKKYTLTGKNNALPT